MPAAHDTPHRREILDTDARFFRALLKQDRQRLEELLADDFFIVDVDAGGLTNRADFVAAADAGLVAFESIETSPAEAVVREYPGAAIVSHLTARQPHRCAAPRRTGPTRPRTSWLPAPPPAVNGGRERASGRLRRSPAQRRRPALHAACSAARH
jgi:hypothetical protein